MKSILKYIYHHLAFFIFFPLGLYLIFTRSQDLSSLIRKIQHAPRFNTIIPAPPATPLDSDFLFNAINQSLHYLPHPSLKTIAQDLNTQIVVSGDIQTTVDLGQLAQKYGYDYSSITSYSFLSTYQTEVELVEYWLEDPTLPFTDPQYKYLGLSLQPATLQNQSGYLITLVFAQPYIPPPTPTPPLITETNLLDALNFYRQNHGKPPLSLSENLCLYSRQRVQEHLTRYANNPNDLPLDGHQGFVRDTTTNDPQVTPLAFQLTGFSHLIENLAFTPNLVTATQVIEWGWDSSAPHREGQLSTDVSHVCISGTHPFYVAIFGS